MNTCKCNVTVIVTESTRLFIFISSGLGAYDKAVVRDNFTGEIIGEIHLCVRVGSKYQLYIKSDKSFA